MTRSIAILSMLALAGCASTHELAVDVFTDYAAGAEFEEVAVWVDDAAEMPIVLAVHPHDDLADPTHIADYQNFPSGYHHVIAELRHNHQPLAQGNAWVRLDGSVLVPISISRRCTVRTCADNASGATECVGGLCVVPMCDPTHASCMGAQCGNGTTCPAPLSSECVDIICDRGTCLRLPRDERCPSVDQFCNPHDAPGSATCDYYPGHEPLGAPTAHAMSTSATTQEITVTWTDTGALSYVVELSADGTFGAGTMMFTTSTRSQVFTGLLGGHQYSARVRSTSAGAAESNVATAITFLPGPTGLGISVSYPGGVRNSGDPDWITPPGGAGNYYYEVAHASAGCAFGSAQYAFRGGYTSPPDIFGSGWQGPDSYIVNVLSPWGAQFWVRARCVTSDATSAETGEVRDCYTHSGAGC